jgi:uncharacterized membrane protein
MTSSIPERTSGQRLQAIDALRGLIMILMALDHVRDFFGDSAASPTNMATTTAALFMTRWITHFCAPVFSLLTGVVAFLWYSRGRTKSALTRFLLARGAWLIFLELTITRCFGWAFNFDYRITLGGVLWILGWSMIVLAIAVWLPMSLLTGVALLTIAGHNLLDAIQPQAFGNFAWLWQMLHSPGIIAIAPGHTFFTAYVLIPWFAVMMAGFSLGQVYLWEAVRRKKFLIRFGLALTALFILVRGINHYGDPLHWATQKSALFTVFSFMNSTKYPPSLDYLLMTLGPALIFLGVIDGAKFDPRRPLIVFGQVPLFYYILHIPLMHLAAVAISYIRYGDAHWFFTSTSIADFPSQTPPGWAFSLGGVYVVWIALVIVLYPLCRWYGEVKRRRGSPWLTYI